MKIFLVFFLFLGVGNSFSQDGTVTWLQNADSSEFKLFYHKNHLPKAFYRVDGIDPKKLANAKDFYSPGCTNPVRGQLNWVAKKENKWVICLTKGSSAVMTIVYFLDKETEKLKAYSTTRPVNREITFAEFMSLLKSGERKLEELDPADFN
ncbi:MAG: hypothetical protein ACO1N0_15430 [Fluviicola sp.]